MSGPSVIIIGAGPSGIAAGYNLLHRHGVSNFTIFERADVGGTWSLNKYPGCGCDVMSHLYSFSFNLNPNWSKELCERDEILQYINDTVDKFGLRKYIHTKIEVESASWNETTNQWDVNLIDLKTGVHFTRSSQILFSCVGAIATPKDIVTPGHETFPGPLFHTARWDDSADLTGKRVAVVGNGCSGSQTVPRIAEKAAHVTHFARSGQWYHERPNHPYSAFQKWVFRNVPFAMRYLRYKIFNSADSLYYSYLDSDYSARIREQAEEGAKAYIRATAPKKYHDVLIPDFPLGCKRRVFDPGYLQALHRPNVDLVWEAVDHIDGSTLVTPSGRQEDFDVVVMATGFKVQEFLVPIRFYGVGGKELADHWKETRGAQAYGGTTVHGFPNFAIIFGPNSFPAHNSVIYTAEVQVEYACKTIVEAVASGRADIVDVKQAAEDADALDVQLKLKGTVWSAGCSNWYLNEFGRNTASYPGLASDYWMHLLWPHYQDYHLEGAHKFWRLRAIYRLLRYMVPKTVYQMVATLAALAFVLKHHSTVYSLRNFLLNR
ncbi:hypothetical protein CANCADRAFT_4319 [Tortispora caseinolytica NRRL Y-17796]|uniref:FAD/NAD(P)-binding domain-containing protein n=1 Tax=Tortispora caseinolytica NRRL Y-17796 TaxID=767744 RepID=A0A1E4TD56_9ASCO|nr:hypothetical protein CANCADRAFT_4319 [Tortispora caseinolytica NRRL Y-17796]